jgi:diaminohydroxyphosphoribosylaminopyrimidine deaminase / 5-amino-6-(5-phosphoribosylamino)uracil reductase
MDAALALARRGLGTTWPNPAVGCVLVKDGRVVGRGFTAPGGRPHAETVALEYAGAAARGATAYVTLEPCSHWGQTSPCADALIAAGVTRVMVGARDPDPRVNGAGLERLRAAGIEVVEGVRAVEAVEALAGFASRVVRGRPLVTLKLASTLDGRIATRTGESKWITGEEARREAHALRGRHDAVMVGVGTVVADDPDLTCRISGFRTRPIVRVVADSGLRTPVAARLVVTARESPTWIIAGTDAEPERVRWFREAGVEVLAVEAEPSGVDMATALRALSSLLRNGLVDRIAWFHAGAVMGGDGLPAVQGYGVARLADIARFRHRCTRAVGGDTLSLFGKD